MEEKKTQKKRGPKVKHLSKEEYDIAHVLAYLYPNKSYDFAYENYDFNQKEKSNLRTAQRAKKKIRDMLSKNDGCIMLERGLDKQRLIEIILDTYPDPDFFTDEIQGIRNWTGDLMMKIFNNDEVFKLQYNKNIFYVCGLNFTEKEYQKGIDDYIKNSTWEKIFYNRELADAFWVVKLKIIPRKDEKLELAPSRRKRKVDGKPMIIKKGHFYQEYGMYDMKITCKHDSGKYKGNYSLKAPKYKGNEKYYIEKDQYNDARPDFVYYPFTSMANVSQKDLKRKGDKEDYDYCRKNFKHFFIEATRELTRRVTLKDEEYRGKLCLLFRRREDEDFIFVLEDSVRNAKIVREWRVFSAVNCN